jgi:hypothetical protein
MTIPSSVTSIGANAIGTCTSLVTVTFLSPTPPTLGGNGFDITNGMSSYPTIIVPNGCSGVYKSASGWLAYKDYIVEAS